MRKIKVVFDKISAIQNLKSIMKNVHNSNSDYLPDIAKFSLGKEFAPERVDRAELRIQTAASEDIITLPKSSLTFFTGVEHPFTMAAPTLEEEAKYIVVPWSLGTQLGRDNLKNLINRIPSGVKQVQYTIYINDANLNQSSTSLAGLNLSNIMAEDETEGLLNKIEGLELKVIKLNDLLSRTEREIVEQKKLLNQQAQEIVSKDATIHNLQNSNNDYYTQILQLKAQIPTVKDEVSWDCRVKNQTILDCVNFTGRIKAITCPSTHTTTVHII